MAPVTRLKRERKYALRQLADMTLLEQKAALLSEKIELRMERSAQEKTNQQQNEELQAIKREQAQLKQMLQQVLNRK